MNFINKDEGNKTVIHAAVIEGHSSVVMFLIQNRVDVNVQDSQSWTPLHYAAQNGTNL